LPSIQAVAKPTRKPLPSGMPSERGTPTPPAASPARTTPTQTTPRQGSPAGPSRPELQKRPTIKLKFKVPKPTSAT
jgi:hypothetical protein